MTRRAALLSMIANLLISAGLIGIHAIWLAPGTPSLATLDVGELYRQQEREIAAVLVKPDASPEERRRALERAQRFGAELGALIERLPEECRCLVVARGAVVGPARRLPDLTPLVRARLGIQPA